MLAAAQLRANPQPAAPPQPQTATDWFRRADSLTNIRLPGSAPFHLKVTFHAYPGVDFNPPKNPAPAIAPVPGHPFIITGDGTYEETWLSPEKWRREVNFGSYHAVEVRADGARKFQASEDYEPARVLMLMEALFEPVPRYLIRPEMDAHPHRWDVESKSAGSVPYVSVSHRFDWGSADLDSMLES